jgi:hypothetical protein
MFGADADSVMDPPLGAVSVWVEKVLVAHNMLSD